MSSDRLAIPGDAKRSCGRRLTLPDRVLIDSNLDEASVDGELLNASTGCLGPFVKDCVLLCLVGRDGMDLAVYVDGDNRDPDSISKFCSSSTRSSSAMGSSPWESSCSVWPGEESPFREREPGPLDLDRERAPALEDELEDADG